MKKILLLMFLMCPDIQASDEWMCSESASQRDGNIVSACGTGIGADEGQARLAAFDNAKAEFDRICGSSSDCGNHKYVAEPKRTTCGQEGSHYKCYRLVLYAIGEEEVDVPRFEDTIALSPQANTQVAQNETTLDAVNRINAATMKSFESQE